ncbi:hypothetical protein JCM5353_002166 [Sporobolomyces roseus]
MSTRPVRTTKVATRGLSVDDVEGGETPGEGEGDEEITGEIELDEARAEERDETWEEPSKRRKKKKKAKEPIMKDRGKLKYFQALPLDLVGEVSSNSARLAIYDIADRVKSTSQICSYLSPLDLLHWGRASKAFRQLFFSSSSTSLWRLARKSVDLPDLTWSMPEPEYASLMYEKHCMDPSCDKENPSLPRYDFYHRLRLCGRCARATFALLDNVAADTGQVQLHTVKRCYVSFKWNPFEETKISNRTCLKNDISTVDRLVSSASKNNFLSLLQGKGKASSEVEKRISEVQAEIKAKEEDGAKLREWNKARLAEIEKQEEEERLRKCRERKAAIEAKFIADGWDPIEYVFSTISQGQVDTHPAFFRSFAEDEWIENELVNTHKKLTPAEWRACREELTDVLDSIRQYRLEIEAEERMNERIYEVHLQYEVLREAQTDEMSEFIFPSEGTFMTWECLQELYQEEKEIDDDQWDAIRPAIDAQLNAYRLGVVQRFVEIVLPVIDDFPNVQNYLGS